MSNVAFGRRLTKGIFARLGFALGLVFFSMPASEAAGRRVALVIGNAAYRNVATLENPVYDSRGISAALKRLGFEVTEGFDETLDSMRKTIGEFSGRLEGASVALVYYAGHGVSVAGENYILPVDTVLKSEADLDFRTINVNLVLRQMQREERVNIVILDACRDNPFKTELARGMKTRSTYVSDGLAEISAKSAAGTLIAFATDPGMTAHDGARGENSPFAAALLKHIETPQLPISSVFDRVRKTVWDATNKKQRPWMNTSLVGEFFLSEPPPPPSNVMSEPVKQASLDAAAPVVAVPVATPLAQSLEMRLWESAERSDTPDEYRAYLESYPNGTFAGMARSRIARGSRTAAVKTPAVTDEQLKGEVGSARTEKEISWTPSERQQAQRRLGALGFKPGRIGPEFRPDARAALAEWQKSRSITETGYLTKVQKMALWEQSEDEYQRSLSAPAERSVRQTRHEAGPRRYRAQPAQRQGGPSLGEVGTFFGGVGSFIGAVRR